MGYLTMLSLSKYVAPDGMMIDDALERIWKEAYVA
jgi:hypothetical protein